MRAIKIALAAVIVSLPLAAGAAELPVAAMHKSRIHHAHARHMPTAHFGYYWYRWGWRSGGTAWSWQGSTFAFVDRW
jgi:hypothetical protein